MDDEEAPEDKSNNGNKNKDDNVEEEDKDLSTEDKAIFDAKFKELQIYVPQIKKLLALYEQKRQESNDVNNDRQYNRFKSLHALFTSKKRYRCKLDTLLKCEEFFKKRFKPHQLKGESPETKPAPPKKKKPWDWNKKCKLCWEVDIPPPHAEDCRCCGCKPPPLRYPAYLCPGPKVKGKDDKESKKSAPLSNPKPGTSKSSTDVILITDDEVKKLDTVCALTNPIVNPYGVLVAQSDRSDRIKAKIGPIDIDSVPEKPKPKPARFVFAEALNKAAAKDGAGKPKDESETPRIKDTCSSLWDRPGTEPVRNESDISDRLQKLYASDPVKSSDVKEIVDGDRKKIRNESSDGRNKLLGSDGSAGSGAWKSVAKTGNNDRLNNFAAASGASSTGSTQSRNSQDASASASSAPNLFNIHDLSKIEIPANVNVQEMLNLLKQSGIPNLGSKPQDANQNCDRTTSVASSASSSFFDSFDVEPLQPSDRGLSAASDISSLTNSNRPVHSLSDSKSSFNSHHKIHPSKQPNSSKPSGSSAKPSSSKPNIDPTKAQLSSSRQSTKPSKIPSSSRPSLKPASQSSNEDKKVHLSDPRRRNSSDVQVPANSANRSQPPSSNKIADPRRRGSTEAQAPVNSNNQPTSTQINPISSWNHPLPPAPPMVPPPMIPPPLMPQMVPHVPFSSQSLLGAPPMNLNYGVPAYAAPHSNLSYPPSNFPNYPPAFPFANPVQPVVSVPQPLMAAPVINNRISSNILELAREESFSPIDDFSTSNDSMQMSPDSPKVKDRPPSSEKETSTKSTTSIRSKLAEGFSTMKKLGKPSEDKTTKGRMLSALKPGVVSDLTASKETRNSLLVDSLKSVPSTKESSAKPIIPVKTPKVPEKNIDTVNSLKTNTTRVGVSKVTPLKPGGKPPLLPAPLVNKAGSSNQKVLQRSAPNPSGSFNETFRSSYHNSPESGNEVFRSSFHNPPESDNETFRSSYHNPPDSETFRSSYHNPPDSETFRSSYHIPPDPANYNRAFPRVDKYSDFKNLNNVPYKSADTLHRSLSDDPPDLWNQTASRWNKDTHPDADARRRYEDIAQRSSELSRSLYNLSEIRSNRYDDHRPPRFDASDPRSRRSDAYSDPRSRQNDLSPDSRPRRQDISPEPRSRRPDLPDPRSRRADLSDPRSRRPDSSDSRSRRPDGSSDPRSRKIELPSLRNRDRGNDSSSAGCARDPRRRDSLEKESPHNRSRSRPSDPIRRSGATDSAKSDPKSTSKVPESEEREDFLSPLDNDARKPQTSVTGRGYGIQNYKIPRKPRPQPAKDTTALSRKDKDSKTEEKQPDAPKASSVVEEAEPLAVNDDAMDVDSNDNFSNLGNITDEEMRSETGSDAGKENAKLEKTTPSQNKKPGKTDTKSSKKPLTKDSSVTDSENSKKSQKPVSSSNEKDQAKKLAEDFKLKMTDKLQKTARVVISSDEECLAARHEGKTKSGASSKPSNKTVISAKITIEDSTDDECDTTVKTKKEPAKTSKAKAKDKVKSTASVESDSDSPIKKASSAKKSVAKTGKLLKKKNSLSSSESSSSDSSDSSEAETTKVTKDTKKSRPTKNRSQRKKSVSSSSKSSSGSDSGVFKKKTAKKTKDTSKDLLTDCVVISSDGSTSEASDSDDSNRRKKKSRSKKKIVSKESDSSSSDSSSADADSSSKSKISAKKKSSKKNCDKSSKLSEAKISSSKKLHSPDQNASKSKKQTKLNQPIQISSDSSSDDEPLAEKIQKIKETNASETILDRESKKSAASNEESSEKEVKDGKKKESEEVSAKTNLDKSDQISCNTVDSTSDTNDTGAKSVVNEAPKNPVEAMMSQFFSGVTSADLLAMMFQSMKDKFNLTGEMEEIMKKLMDAKNLEKVKQVLNEGEASSSGKSLENDPKASKEAADAKELTEQIKTLEPASEITTEKKDGAESSASDASKTLTMSVDQNDSKHQEPIAQNNLISKESSAKNDLISKELMDATPKEPSAVNDPVPKESNVENAPVPKESNAENAPIPKESNSEKDLNVAKELEKSTKVETKRKTELDRLHEDIRENIAPVVKLIEAQGSGITARNESKKKNELRSGDSTSSIGSVAKSDLSFNSNTDLLSEEDVEQMEVESSSEAPKVSNEAISEHQRGKVGDTLEHPKKKGRKGKKGAGRKNLALWRQQSMELSQNGESLSIEERTQIYKEKCLGVAKEFEKAETKKVKKHKRELDKLHDDINENIRSVVNLTGVRRCRKVPAVYEQSSSPEGTPEKQPAARVVRKPSSEKSENTEKSANLKAARVFKRKVSAQQYIDLSGSDDDDDTSHKRHKFDFTDSPPPVLEAYTDFKGIKPTGSKDVPEIVTIPPPLEVVLPVIDLPNSDLPEIYALDYFTPKFRRKRFSRSEFERKYILPDLTNNFTERCLNVGATVKLFGCGRRLDRKRTRHRSVVTSLKCTKTLEPKKCQNETKPPENLIVPALPEMKSAVGRMTRMMKDIKPVLKENSVENEIKEPKKQIKTAEEVKADVRSLKAAQIKDPDIDDFILVLDKKAKSLTSSNPGSDSRTLDEAAKNFKLKKEVNWVDPDYYYKSGVNMDCKLCSYTGKHIADHYLLYHSEDQVLSSRLHFEEAESAIAESHFLDYSDVPDEFLIRFPSGGMVNGTVINKECVSKLLLSKWLKDHSEDLTSIFETLIDNSFKKNGDLKISSTLQAFKTNLPADLFDFLYRLYRSKMRMNLFFCRMCNDVYDNARKFFEHISMHTGEYLYECTPCQLILPSIDDFSQHEDTTPGDHLLTNRYPLPPDSSILFGYICSACYYVQLTYESLLQHLSMHEDDAVKPQIVRINMSKSAPSSYLESLESEDTVAKKWPDYNKNKMTSSSCPKFCSSVDDLVCLAKQFKDLSCIENDRNGNEHSSVSTNPFAKSLSTEKSTKTSIVDRKASHRSTANFNYNKTQRLVNCSNFSDVIVKLSDKSEHSFFFCKSLNVDINRLNDLSSKNEVMGEEGSSLEHNYASSKSRTSTSSAQKKAARESSTQSRYSFLKDLHERLNTKGGKNLLTELEKIIQPPLMHVAVEKKILPASEPILAQILKPTLQKKVQPVPEVPVLDLTKEPNSITPSRSSGPANSTEAEAPTIHIPDSECPLPNMNVIDFSLQMTTGQAENVTKVHSIPPNKFVNLASLANSPPPKPSPSSSPKATKTIPSLIPIPQSAEKPEKYQMKDPVVRKLRVGPVGAIKLSSNFVHFSCFAPGTDTKCCGHIAETVNQLLAHFNQLHPAITWNGLCEPCGHSIVLKGLKKYTISLACRHLVDTHLTPATPVETPENNPVLAIMQRNAVSSVSKPSITVNNVQQTSFPVVVSTAGNQSPARTVEVSAPVVEAPPPAPKPPLIRVRPMTDLIDPKNLSNQTFLNLPSTSEKETEGNIQIASVMSLSSTEGNSAQDFASPTSRTISQPPAEPKVTAQPQRLDKSDKLLYMTPTGPKRMLSITLKDPVILNESDGTMSSADNFGRSRYKFKIHSGMSKMDELMKGQTNSFVASCKDPCSHGVLFLLCRVCSIYHSINFNLFQLECPVMPRVLVVPNKEVKFTVTEILPSMVNNRMKHSVFPLTIPQAAMKHRVCYEKMLTEQPLMKLFKCMGNLCSFTAVDGDSFTRHIQNHELYVKALAKKIGRKDLAFKKILKVRDWNLCAYCGISAEGPIDLKDHIEKEHGRSPFQCGYCFYRTFSLIHVAWHQVYAHDGCEPNILPCTPRGKNTFIPAADVLKPFVCAIGSCKFSTYARQSFKDHLSSQHISCNVLFCHVCGAQVLTIERLLMHYRLHQYCLLQCLFCVHGAESVEEMKLHIMNHHFSKPACVYIRNIPPKEQLQIQKGYGWMVKLHLEDKVILHFFKEVKEGYKAKTAVASDSLQNDLEEVFVEEKFYLEWMTEFVNKQGTKPAPIESKPVSAEKTGDVEEFEIVAGNGEATPSDQPSFGSDQPAVSNTQPEGLGSRLRVILTNPEKEKELAERRKLHQATLYNRIKELDGAFSLESGPQCLPVTNTSVKEVLLESLDTSTFAKYVESAPDVNKDTDSFKLTKDCIDSLSVSIDDSVDLNTLYEMGENLESRSSTALLTSNQTGDSAANNPSEVPATSSHATDNTVDSGLSGLDLYRCGNEGCSFAAETSNNLKDHISVCDLSRSSSGLTCVHCKKLFKYAQSLVEHLRAHGTQRFSCSLCSMRAPVPHRIITHMKSAHRISGSRLHPINPLQTDIDSSVFIVVPKDKQLIGVNKVNPKTGCKISFNPSEISEIPTQKIYSEAMWCAVCPYKSMVRVNLLNHLKAHAIGMEPLIKDYFNPLSTSESKELEPLTNHALSARMAEERASKEDGAPILTEHILADLHCNYLTEFVPPNGRYKCHVADCSYITLDASMLCNHLKSLHSDVKTYLCPHCPRSLVQPVKFEKIRSHLKFHDETLHKCSYCEFYHYKKYLVDRHVVLEHPSLAQKTDLIRGSNSDDGKNESAESSQANQDAQRSALKPWHCGLCRYRTLIKTDIAVHCFSVHGVYNQYKCVLCPFSNNSLYDFDAHYFEKHPGISKQILCVFDEVTSVGENDPVNDVLASRDICHYIPEKFRLKNGLTEERVSLKVEDYIKLKGRYRMLAKLGIDDKNGLHGPVGEPDSNGNFVCPRCLEYRTANVEDMKCHMYRELNYKLFKCGHCNLASSQFHDLAIHSEAHMRLGDDPCVQQLEPNPDYDAWIDRMIAIQKSMMKSKKEGNSKEDLPEIENKFWRFGTCSRECMPSYQRFCPSVLVRRPTEDDDTKQPDTKSYRCPPASDEDDDNFIDLIVSDSDEECSYGLAPESIPAPSESLSASLTTTGSKIEKYRKSKRMPKIDLTPRQFQAINESDLKLLDVSSSSDEEIVVDCDGTSPNVSAEGSMSSSLTDGNSSAAEKYARLKCVDCGVSFSAVGALKVHIRRVHLNLKRYTCIHCEEKFALTNQIKAHLTNVHKDPSDKSYLINDCNISPDFWSKRYNIQSEESSKAKKKFGSGYQEDLKFSCFYCAFKSNDILAVYLHWKHKHKDPVYLMKDKLKNFTGVPFKHRTSAAESSSAEDKIIYECVHCKVQGAAEELINHYGKAHPSADFQIINVGKRKYNCIVCHLRFNSIDSMKRHFFLDHPGRSVQYSIVTESHFAGSRYDGEKLRKFHNFLEAVNIPGKIVFYSCPLCSYFADDTKKMHHHLRKHVEVYICCACKRRFPDVSKARCHNCEMVGKTKTIKKHRLTKEKWEQLKTTVKIIEKPITQSLLNTKNLPVKMPPRKRKHRSKGIPQKNDVKRMRMTHCAKKSTSGIPFLTPMVPTTSTQTGARVKVNQTARKSTGPRRPSIVPYSFYGRKSEPVNIRSLFITLNFGGVPVKKPLSVLYNIENLNPIVKVVDIRKKAQQTQRNNDVIDIL